MTGRPPSSSSGKRGKGQPPPCSTAGGAGTGPGGGGGGGGQAPAPSARGQHRCKLLPCNASPLFPPEGGDGDVPQKGSKPTSADPLFSARDLVSDDLRRVLEEDVVTYSWCRKDKDTGKPSEARSAEAAHQGQRKAADDISGSPAMLQGCSQHSGAAKPESSGTPQKSDTSAAAPQTEGRLPGASGEERPPSREDGRSDTQGPSFGPNDPPLQGAPPTGVPRRSGGQPPRPVASRALVSIVSTSPGPAGERSTAAGAAAPEWHAGARIGGVGTADFAEVARTQAARLVECAATPPELGAKLVAYDGGALRVKGSVIAGACSHPLRAWTQGRLSGELACLHVEEWAQGEVLWPDAAGGPLQRRLGVVAGMLSDASLERAYTAELHRAVFSQGPAAVASDAAREVVVKARLEDGTVLVSEVEHALSMAEADAYAEGPAARLAAAVRRELLRIYWEAGGAEEEQDEGAVDAWLLEELTRSPAAAASAAHAATAEQLRRENRTLDEYFVRLLKLKRALSRLLDEWEQVNHYAILGVSPTLTDKELRNAYRKACLRLHPDKGGDKAQFQQLQDAYASILEERAKQKPQGSAGDAAVTPCTTAAAGGSTAGFSNRRNDGSVGRAAELMDAVPDAPPAASQNLAAAEVVAAERELDKLAEAVVDCVRRAEQAQAVVQNLKQVVQDGGVETLRAAQSAGESMLALGEEVGKLGPALGEAAMELAEVSLAFAARFGSVPAAILLTDVALSCTFEASRVVHGAKQLLEVRRDTETTLQTLKSNLQMANIIGKVDADMLKLSLGLVGKAGGRIVASMRQVASAVADAVRRGRQCCKHAKSIAMFVAGRAAADEEASEGDAAAQAALTAPEGSEFVAPPTAPSSNQSWAPTASPRAAFPASPRAGSAASPPPGERPLQERGPAPLEARLQNDRLLRQLNTELLELQRRARAHLAKNSALLLTEVSPEARARTLRLVVEVLVRATEVVESEFRPDAEFFDSSLARRFGFVAAASGAAHDCLAMSLDLRTQLVRLSALLDAQAVISALEKGAKARLAQCCETVVQGARAPFTAALDRHFHLLCTAVVGVRMA